MKRAIWEHEKDELICDDRIGAAHLTDEDMASATAEAVLLPGARAAILAWLYICKERSWIESLMANHITERKNNPDILGGDGFTQRMAKKRVADLGGTIDTLDAVTKVHLVADIDHSNMFEPIFDRHFGAVHRYLHRRGGRDLADELAAETFALAFERRASCRGTGSALPWLYGIATNLLRRRWRAERRQLRAYGRSGVDRWADYGDEATARVDGSSLDARLAQALALMRPRERDALLLYALAELSYEEIAVALDVPVGTVRTWLHRAREVARRELAAETDVFPLTASGADLNG